MSKVTLEELAGKVEDLEHALRVALNAGNAIDEHRAAREATAADEHNQKQK